MDVVQYLGAGLAVMAGIGILTLSIMSQKSGHELFERWGSVVAVGLAGGSVIALAYWLPEDLGWRGLLPFLAVVSVVGIALGVIGHRVIKRFGSPDRSN